ncbi:MAG TPA: helix-turn-helix domain-containing protein [Hyphomicrobiaceae bacterium]|nr:helix-turn-helix domain-containing protein [Hyphomicrobiaceae bacterium]
MSKQRSNPKPVERRPERRAVVQAKRAASKMAGVEDVADELGIGLNLAYALMQAGKIPGTMRLGRRYLVSRVTLAKITNGEMILTV